MPTSASPSVIAVILPNAPDVSMLEALKRLRGEAESVGLELRLLQAESALDPRTQLARVAQELAVAAAVELVAAPGDRGSRESPTARASPATVRSMDVWYLDPTSGETSLGQLIVEEDAGARADLVLAVRVVDFIRARMFDSLVRSLAAAKAKANSKSAGTAAYELEGNRHIKVGLSSTGSFSGFAAAFLPSIELGFTLRPRFRLTLAFAGLGTKPRRELPTVGFAILDQKLVQASAVFLGHPWWRLQPFLAAGVTTYFLSVQGVGYSGYVGYHPSGWSPGVHGMGGFGIALGRHVSIELGGGVLFLIVEPKAYVGDTEVARTGRPAWLAQASVGTAF